MTKTLRAVCSYELIIDSLDFSRNEHHIYSLKVLDALL